MTESRRALLIVDVQPDFCEGGALAVDGGNAVAEAISQVDTSPYATVIASQDWHLAPPHDNCGHFALHDDPDFVTSWPVHCVVDTEGAALHPALGRMAIDHAVRKGTGTQSYSAFEGVTTEGSSILAILRSEGITDVDVCGIATDYCVRASVLDALGTGFAVRLFTDLIAGVANESSEAAVLEMTTAGAEAVTSGVVRR